MPLYPDESAVKSILSGKTEVFLGGVLLGNVADGQIGKECHIDPTIQILQLKVLEPEVDEDGEDEKEDAGAKCKHVEGTSGLTRLFCQPKTKSKNYLENIVKVIVVIVCARCWFSICVGDTVLTIPPHSVPNSRF